MNTSQPPAADVLPEVPNWKGRVWQPLFDWLVWPEFRIPNPPLPAETARRLADFLTANQIDPKPDAVTIIPPPPPVLSPEICRLFTDTAVFLWRMQQRAAKPDGGLDRKTALQIERLAGILKQAGVETIDLTGQEYKTGWDVRVSAFQPSATVRVPTVRETQLPSVFFGSEMLQRADIIVDEPEVPPVILSAEAAASNPSAPASAAPVQISPYQSTTTPA